jgi:hypothetical protein
MMNFYAVEIVSGDLNEFKYIRLRPANGSCVTTISGTGKFGKVWSAPGFLRRHVGNRLPLDSSRLNL